MEPRKGLQSSFTNLSPTKASSAFTKRRRVQDRFVLSPLGAFPATATNVVESEDKDRSEDQDHHSDHQSNRAKKQQQKYTPLSPKKSLKSPGKALQKIVVESPTSPTKHKSISVEQEHSDNSTLDFNMDKLGRSLSNAFLSQQLDPSASTPNSNKIILNDRVTQYFQSAQVSSATEKIAKYWLRHMLRMYDMPKGDTDNNDSLINVTLSAVLNDAVENISGVSRSKIFSKLVDSILARIKDSSDKLFIPSMASHFRDLSTNLPSAIADRDLKLVNASKERLDLMETQNELQKQLTVSAERIKELVSTVGDLQASNAELRSKQADMEEVLDEAVKAELVAKKTLKILYEKIDELETESHRDLQHYDVKCLEYNDEIASLKGDAVALVKLREEFVSLSETNEILEKQLEKSRDTQSTLKSQVDSLSSTKKEQELKNKMVKVRLASSIAQKLKMKERIEEIDSQPSASAVRASIESKYQSEILNLKDQLNREARKVQNLEAQLLKDEKEAAAHDAIVRDLNNVCRKFEEKTEQQKQMIEAIYQQRETLKERLAEHSLPYKSEIEDLKAQVKELMTYMTQLLVDYEKAAVAKINLARIEKENNVKATNTRKSVKSMVTAHRRLKKANGEIKKVAIEFQLKFKNEFSALSENVIQLVNSKVKEIEAKSSEGTYDNATLSLYQSRLQGKVQELQNDFSMLRKFTAAELQKSQDDYELAIKAFHKNISSHANFPGIWKTGAFTADEAKMVPSQSRLLENSNGNIVPVHETKSQSFNPGRSTTVAATEHSTVSNMIHVSDECSAPNATVSANNKTVHSAAVNPTSHVAGVAASDVAVDSGINGTVVSYGHSSTTDGSAQKIQGGIKPQKEKGNYNVTSKISHDIAL